MPLLDAREVQRLEPVGHDAVRRAELTGNTTAHDLGLGRMLKTRGDFIGRRLAARPALHDPARLRLAGVRPVDRQRRLRAGAHLVHRLGETASQGYLTSVTIGAEIEGWLGLALLSNGPALVGRHMVATSPLHAEEVPVEICSPHFVDSENARVRS
jgi:sarcosine oxidase subunit alpha